MTSMVQELAAHPELIYRHTVEEYHDMIASGAIMEGEPFELLDGQIVRKIRSASGENIMTVGIEHALIVNRLAKISGTLEPLGCHLRTQQPVTIPPRDEPEPDGVIARGSLEDYATHHPYASDILCIIEVADSSLSRDRGYKLQLYAAAGVPMYVIVNLIDRVVEVHEQPVADRKTYAQTDQLVIGQSIDLPTASSQSITLPVAQLFQR